MRTSALGGLPLLPSGGVAQPEIIVNEALLRCEMLSMGIAVAIRTVPLGTETEGQVFIVGTPATGDFEDQDNKLARLTSGAYLFFPDVTTDGDDIPMGEQHAGIRIYVQDDGSSPPVPGWKLWDGSAWIDD